MCRQPEHGPRPTDAGPPCPKAPLAAPRAEPPRRDRAGSPCRDRPQPRPAAPSRQPKVAKRASAKVRRPQWGAPPGTAGGSPPSTPQSDGPRHHPYLRPREQRLAGPWENRARGQPRLHDERGAGEPRNEPVAGAEGVGLGRKVPFVLGDHRAAGRHDALEEPAFSAGYTGCSRPRGRPPCAPAASHLVGHGVAAPRAPGDDGDAALGGSRGKALGAAAPGGRRAPRTRDGQSLG